MSEYPEIAERFARDTARHAMTVLHADGLYRHLRFTAPEQGRFPFELITWPYNLVAQGRITAIRKVWAGNRWQVKWRLDGRPRVRTFAAVTDARECQRYVMAQAAEGDRRG
ncbi:hypothetical protein [Streptomyces sp. NPDC059788]|uniref:hypothetical protein n=1 Tax=Streptomyces sp. NPDC059788 TaxID=3346948 RepID=UPI0036587EF2